VEGYFRRQELQETEPQETKSAENATTMPAAPNARPRRK
jgi:hypothetical protein